MNKFVVGLTGGIGSGKSTIAKLFMAKGVSIIDADQCSRIVVAPGKPALQEICKRFGSDILLPNGTLNRPRLRQIIFTNAADKSWLEQLLHPLIFSEIIRQLDAAPGSYAILESPLLIEAGQSQICQRILVVDAREEIQIQRAMQRDNNSRELIEAVMRTQSSRSDRLAKADDVIENNDSGSAALEEKVQQLHEHYNLIASRLQ